MKLTALVCAVLFSVVCFAATPTIGVLTSSSEDETNLIEGSPLKTDNTASEVRLDNGASVRFAPRSAGTIFSDHVVLEQGAARVSHFDSYQLEAGGLSIIAETPETSAVIRMEKGTIQVASLGGPAKVSAGGTLLTRVASGSRVSFQNTGATAGQTGASTAGHRHLTEGQVWLIVILGISAAAIAIGVKAAADGKSPF